MPRIATTCLRSVKTGPAVGGGRQVLDGLRPGDPLVVMGLQNIHRDTKVDALSTEPVVHDAKFRGAPASPPGM